MKVRAIKIALAAMTMLMLVSCWFPERYRAELEVRPDGTYVMTCEAMMVLIGQAKETAADKARESAKELMKEDPDYKKVEYMGSNRYRVSYRSEGKLQVDKTVELFSMDGSYPLITMRLYKDGELEILGYRLSKETEESLKKENLQMLEGQIAIKAAGEVEYSNAQERESGLHKWRLRHVMDRMPAMYVKTQLR